MDVLSLSRYGVMARNRLESFPFPLGSYLMQRCRKRKLITRAASLWRLYVYRSGVSGALGNNVYLVYIVGPDSAGLC